MDQVRYSIEVNLALYGGSLIPFLWLAGSSLEYYIAKYRLSRPELDACVQTRRLPIRILISMLFFLQLTNQAVFTKPSLFMSFYSRVVASVFCLLSLFVLMSRLAHTVEQLGIVINVVGIIIYLLTCVYFWRFGAWLGEHSKQY